MKNDWKPEVDEKNVSKLKEPTKKLEHMYREVDKYLTYLLNSADQIDNKISILLGFQITIILGLLAFVFSNSYFVLPTFFSLLFGFISLYFSWKGFRLQEMEAPGNEPKNYLTKECLKDRDVDSLLFEDIESYQERIDITHILVSEKGQHFTDAMKFLLLVPVVFILVEIMRSFLLVLAFFSYVFPYY